MDHPSYVVDIGQCVRFSSGSTLELVDSLHWRNHPPFVYNVGPHVSQDAGCYEPSEVMSTLSKLESNNSRVGSLFILTGGILAVVFSAAHVFFTLLVGRALRTWMAGPMVWERRGANIFSMIHMGRLMFGFMVIGAVASIILGVVAIYAYTRVKTGKVQNGGLIAIIVGIIIMASTHWLVGILTLVGVILCYTSTR